MILLKRLLPMAALACAAVLAGLYWMGTREDAFPPPASAAAGAQADAGTLLERGRYLARIGNCAACHTAPGGRPYAGGTSIPTPFGTFHGPNITPDPATGIGAWTADDFWRAVHDGKAPGGRLLYPAFPYTEYTHLSRADSDALFAFLKSVPPVRQASRPHDLEFPYDQRALMAFWRALYFRPGGQPDRADAGRPAQWLRGRYLVQGLGHCAACHAPRNALGATRDPERLAGGMIPGLGWYAPPLGGDAVAGLGRWSEQDIALLLKTGLSPHSTASGPMAEVVLGSSQHLSDADAMAVAVYLKSLPATPPALDANAGTPSAALMEQGGKLYTQHCVQCHQADGRGSGQAWPPLAGNPTVTAPSPANLVRVVLEGGFAPATEANPRPHGMPPFGLVLSDNDVAALASYVRNSWGNAAGLVRPLEVKRSRDAGGD